MYVHNIIHNIRESKMNWRVEGGGALCFLTKLVLKKACMLCLEKDETRGGPTRERRRKKKGKREKVALNRRKSETKAKLAISSFLLYHFDFHHRDSFQHGTDIKASQKTMSTNIIA